MSSIGPVFYYDLGSPWCYPVAERIMAELPAAAEWEPIHAARIGIAGAAPDVERLSAAIERDGLLPLRLPAVSPVDTELAMLVATYAKRGGRAVAYSLAAFRQAYAGGRDLGDEGTVLIAAAACEMHPTAVLKAVRLRSTAAALQLACDRARGAGVTALPAIGIGDELFQGQDALELAGAAISGRPSLR